MKYKVIGLFWMCLVWGLNIFDSNGAEMGDVRKILIRPTQGWTFTVRKDGSATLEYGSSFGSSITDAPGTFSLDKIYNDLHLEALGPKTQGPIGVGVFKGEKTEGEPYVSRNEELVGRLIHVSIDKSNSPNKSNLVQLISEHPVF